MKKNNTHMRKILSLIAAFAIIANIFAGLTAFAYTPAMPDEDIFGLLKQLNIINTEVDAADANVTRENFAVYVANMLNIGENATDKRYYADVENTAYSSKAINTLAERGILSAAADSYFNPGLEITKDEAVKMLVCAVGGKAYAEAKGGYPFGYNSVARELGINISGDNGSITTTQAAQLVFKTMTVPMVDYDAISSESVSFRKSDDNILSMYWDISYDMGTITSVYDLTFDGEEAEEKDEVSINGKKFKSNIDLGDTTQLIGKYVDYFFYDKEGSTDKQIIYISENTNQGKERLNISIDDFEGYTEDTINYSDPNKNDKSVKVDLGAHRLIYNGMELGSDVEKTMKSLNKGYIYVIDADVNGTYDTVVVFDFENFYVSAKTNDVIYNKLKTDSFADMRNADYLSLRDTDGNVLGNSDIEANNLLSVAKSKDGKRIWAYKSNTTFNGTVETINGTDKKIKVNDTMYEIDPSYADSLMSTTNAGDKKYFVLDMFSKIGYASTESTDDMKYGFVVAYSIDGIFESELNLKLLTEESELKVITVSDAVSVDGERYKNDSASKLKNILDNVKGEKLIRYTEDAEGKITRIDTTTVNYGHESEESSLTAAYYETENSKWFNSGYLGRKAFVDGNTKVFYVPTFTAEDADYKCANISYMLLYDAGYNADAFYSSNLNGIASAAVVKYSLDNITKNISSQKTYFIYDDVEEKLNADGEAVRFINGISGVGEGSFEVADDVSLDGIDKGDMVIFSYDSRGRIIKMGTDYTMVYDASKPIAEQRDDEGKHWVPMEQAVKDKGYNYLLYKNVGSGNYYRMENQLSYGTAVKKYSDGIIAISSESTSEITEVVNSKNLTVIVVEKNNRGEIEIRKGGTEDIVTSESGAANVSKILFWNGVGAGKGIYVYNI